MLFSAGTQQKRLLTPQGRAGITGFRFFVAEGRGVLRVLNERNRKILETIIEIHTESAEPVGSQAISRRSQIGLSPASIRNVMAELEELGYISSPHTSAGRIPTEKAFRFYVETLLQAGEGPSQGPDSEEEGSRLRGLSLEEALRRVSRTLSDSSRYTGLVVAPRFASAIFRRIEFVSLAPDRILVVLVSESGIVQQKIIPSAGGVSQAELEQAANYLNRTLSGLSVIEAQARILREMAEEKALYDAMVRRALSLSREALKDDRDDQVFIEGTSHILDQPEFADIERMRRLLHAFEQKSLLAALLERSRQAEGVQIVFGSETEHSEVQGCSFITANYSTRGGARGTVGIVGPVRMPYTQVIPLVGQTARLISRLLESK